jgi:type VI secretion system protein ImpF
MSGRGSTGTRGSAARVLVPLLDRLIDNAPDQTRDPPMSASESMVALRQSVRRDLESLLNARRCWKSWPASLTELRVSPVGYGIPDFTSGAFNDTGRREELRLDIEEAILAFEPRFLSVRVALIESTERLEATLRLRIDAVLHAEPMPEPITFDTIIDPTTDNIVVRTNDAG